MKKLRVRRGAQTTGEANWGNKFYRAGYLLEQISRFYLIQDEKKFSAHLTCTYKRGM